MASDQKSRVLSLSIVSGLSPLNTTISWNHPIAGSQNFSQRQRSDKAIIIFKKGKQTMRLVAALLLGLALHAANAAPSITEDELG